IDERLLQKAEIASALLRRRDDRLPRLAAALAVSFERTEEKRFVPDDRASGRAAVLIEFERRRLRRREEVLRLKFVAAEELPAGAAEGIGPGLRHHIDDRPGVAAELCGEVARLDFELLHGVDVRAG